MNLKPEEFVLSGNNMAKLYTFGCSWTWGTGLPEKDRERLRYSNLLATKLKMEEVNLSETGGSNTRNIFIILDLLLNNTIKNDDIILFQITGLERHQIPLSNNMIQYPFIESGISNWDNLSIDSQKFLKEYVSKLDDSVFENWCRLSLYNLCSLLETKPYKSIFIPAFTDINFELSNFYPKMLIYEIMEKTSSGLYADSHPNEVGHQIITDYILNNCF